jgi:hypothetical protein
MECFGLLPKAVDGKREMLATDVMNDLFASVVRPNTHSRPQKEYSRAFELH